MSRPKPSNPALSISDADLASALTQIGAETLIRRRVAVEMRLGLSGADRGMIEGLKALGCFTEIIAFQLRVFHRRVRPCRD